MLRRGLFVQGGILLIVALMVGIMHIAPLGADHAVAHLAPPPATGFVRVIAHPWGHVAVDGEPLGTTPMAKPLPIRAGRHLLTISHDQFEPVQRQIVVPENSFDDPLVIHVDLEDVGTRLKTAQEPPSGPAPEVEGPGTGATTTPAPSSVPSGPAPEVEGPGTGPEQPQ
jgi:hypothetical protein